MAPRLSPPACCLKFSSRLAGEPTRATAAVLVGRKFGPPTSAAFSTTTNLEARGGLSKITKQRRDMFRWLRKNSMNLEFLSERVSQRDRAFSNPFGERKDAGRGRMEGDAARPSADGTSVMSEGDAEGGLNQGGKGDWDRGGSGGGIQAPQYVTGNRQKPFPLNNLFMSEAVLDDESRNLIYRLIMDDGRPVKTVSATYGVDIRRVAAVVRLKEVEKQWIQTGKRLAKPYANAVCKMLPMSHIEGAKQPHESINDVHVHRYTQQQLFLPVSESKRFTREDAARAFHRYLLPADKRVPIPELVRYEKDMLEGKSMISSMARLVTDTTAMEQQMADRIRNKEEREAKRVTKVETDRFEYRFQKFEVEDVGKTGRGKKGTGWRYGVPLYDRQRGHSREVPDKVGL